MTGLRRAASIAVLFALASTAWRAAQQQGAPLAITHVAVVDVAAGVVQPDQNVIVQDGRIRQVGAASAVRVPLGMRTVDGSGAWLIPGLWDMHVHLGMGGRSALLALVANGVVGVRDMGGSFERVRAWRDSVAAGAIIGPRIEMVGPIVENAQWLNVVVNMSTRRGDLGIAREMGERIPVATVDDARAAVAKIAALGVSMLKVRTDPPAPAYFELLREARRRGLRVVGHPPERGPSLVDASDSGQASIEHQLLDYNGGNWVARLDPMSPAERATLYERFRTNHTAYDPTLIAGVGFRRTPDSVVFAILADTAATRDRRRAFVSPAMIERWRSQMNMKADEGPQPDWNRLAINAAPYVRSMDSAGVSILAGTDLGTPLTYPGFALHDELALLVREGQLTPARALRAATLAPAQFFGREKESGAIGAGMRADLVLLDANPLADIANTQHIRAVILGGRLLDRRALDALLRDVTTLR
jgi:hypothetical protein